MTLRDALETLGIDRSADFKTARRAYLRGIKKHKPEQDPEGFQRMREAWEVVQRFTPKDAPPREVLGFHGSSVIRLSTGSLAKPQDPAPSAPETGMVEVPDLEDSGPDASEPDPAPSPEPSPPPEAGMVEVPDPDEDPWELHDRLHDAIEDGDGDQALVLARTLLRDHPHDVHTGSLVSATLHLYGAGQRDAANSLVTDFAAWLDDHGGEIKGLPVNSRLDWVLTRELHAVAGVVTPEFAAQLAQAIRSGEPGSRELMVAARAFAAADRVRAGVVLTRLRAHAPSLLELVGPAFEFVARGATAALPDSPDRSSSFKMGCGTWVLVYVVVRALVELAKNL